ncbi:hypothetical protein AVEN_112203-1 [Araneus ventricosus]|uniref:Uncharacterized protein n=1 Tax=Araneus ventricosus TaxID=182803 RepID=A0A4Y2NN38_ARAVE|nr:hypothetical protein AVEN_112203-1 [Araneus ventricosus]
MHCKGVSPRDLTLKILKIKIVRQKTRKSSNKQRYGGKEVTVRVFFCLAVLSMGNMNLKSVILHLARLGNLFWSPLQHLLVRDNFRRVRWLGLGLGDRLFRALNPIIHSKEAPWFKQPRAGLARKFGEEGVSSGVVLIF